MIRMLLLRKTVSAAAAVSAQPLTPFIEAKFTAKQMQRVVARRPDLLSSKEKFVELQNYLKTISSLKQPKYLFLDYLELLDIGQKEINMRLQKIRSLLNLQQKQINQVFERCPRLIAHFQLKDFQKKLQFFKDFIDLKGGQIGQISLKFPFITAMDRIRMQLNIQFLISKGFSHQEVKSIVTRWPEFLQNPIGGQKFLYENCLKQHTFLKDHDLKTMILKHPRILSSNPGQMLFPKFKLLRNKFSIPKKFMTDCLRAYPVLLVYSTVSLQTKMKYLCYKLKINMATQPAFPHILQKTYTKFLKPRCQLNLAKDNKLTLLEIYQLSQADFNTRLGISQEQFQKKRDQHKGNYQLDYQRKWFTRWCNNLYPDVI